MILSATCPACGIQTLIEEGQDWRCCGCKEQYVFAPDPERNTPEEIAEWEARQ
jgi:hypothetical protein